MNRLLAILALGAVFAAACGDDNNKADPDTVSITLFAAAPDSIEPGGSTRLLFAIDPPTATVAIEGVGDVTGSTETRVTPTATTTYRLTATNGTATAESTVTVTVGAINTLGLKVSAATPTPTAGQELAVTVTAVASDGNPATGYRGTVHFASSDAMATLPADITFTAADAGVKQVMVTLKTAGLGTLTATDTSQSGRKGATDLTVRHAAASVYQLSALPATATAGQSLVMTITARDPYGNLATTYAGSAALTSTDATDVLPGPGGFTAGVRTVTLAFVKTGSHFATVAEMGGGGITAVATSNVVIAPAAPFRIEAVPTNTATIAGTAENVTVRVLDLYDNLCTNFLGTVHFSSSDAQATLPADYTYTAGDAGTHDFSVTLKTAGPSSVTVNHTTSTARGSASWTVGHAAASVYQLTALPAAAAAGQSLVLTITARDAFGNVATGYAGTSTLTSADATDVLPGPGGFTAGVRTVNLAFVRAGSHLATVSEVGGGGAIAPVNTSNVAVVGGAPTRIDVTPVDTTAIAGVAESITVTLTDVYGNRSTAYTGTVHFASNDANAVLPPDYTFTAADAGTRVFGVTLRTSGLRTLTVSDTVLSTSGATAWTVGHAAASTYQLTSLPSTAAAGQSLVLTITALDAFGNVATTYAGSATLTSTDATDVLPGAGGFTAGVRTVSLAFVKAGSHFATVAEVSGGGIASVNTSNVTVGAAAPFRIDVTPSNTLTTAGAAAAFNVKVLDVYGNTATNYLGTVHFASNDPNATLPFDYTFTAADAGTHDFSLTLRTAGLETVSVSDTVSAVSGSADWTVGAAAGVSCNITQAPTTAVAGTVVGLTVTVHDAFSNIATAYAGTVRMTATDARALLPADVTYVPLADDGSHAFSVGLLTTGNQTVTATDIANATLSCTADIAITPAAPKLVVGIPANANAGYPVTVDLAVKDLFDNAIPNFTGTVSFTNSDTGTGAVAPAPITFTGSEGGVGSSSATFATLGNQIIGATAFGTAPGTGAVAVHGLVYTAPTSGRVRFVVNAAQSTTSVVQLDLIANERLERSTFFGGGPGSFTVGMNLPLDTTRVSGDATLFTVGPALPTGTGALPALGRIAPDNVLYTVVSRKRVAGTNFTQSTEVAAGQVFYSVRLRLRQTASVGAVFDGTQPGPLFAAAIRDQFGDDFVNQGEFGVGKLEVR